MRTDSDLDHDDWLNGELGEPSRSDRVQVCYERRLPKATAAVHGTQGFWVGLSREDLNKEAAKRFPSATTGEVFTGVTLMVAKKHGTL